MFILKSISSVALVRRIRHIFSCCSCLFRFRYSPSQTIESFQLFFSLISWMMTVIFYSLFKYWMKRLSKLFSMKTRLFKKFQPQRRLDIKLWNMIWTLFRHQRCITLHKKPKFCVRVQSGTLIFIFGSVIFIDRIL